MLSVRKFFLISYYLYLITVYFFSVPYLALETTLSDAQTALEAVSFSFSYTLFLYLYIL